MCNAQTLAHSNDGYIIRCRECRRVQLAFGTAALTIDEEQLLTIKEKIYYEMQYRGISYNQPALKQISIEINASTMLCLSINEVTALQDLMDQAFAVIDAYRIIEKPMEWEN